MIICVNGCPKSGTHAALKAVELLGQPVDDVYHIPFGEPLPDGATKHIFIKRDPRNVIISWLRFNGRTVTDGTIMAAAQESDNGASLLQISDGFLGWLTDPNTHVVKFEDLIASDTALRGIAAYLGVPYLDTAFPNLPGYTITWTGDGAAPAYSDYTQVWTPALAAFWTANGGDQLVSAYGY